MGKLSYSIGIKVMDKGVYSRQGPHRMGRGDLVGRTTVVGRSGRSALEPAVLQGLLLAALCAAGMLAGFWYAGRCQEDAGQTLQQYLEGYCQLYSDTGSAVSTLTAVRLYFSYIVAAFLLGFTALGTVALPALAIAYGFTAMFSVASFVGCFGRSGVLLALAALGVRVAFTLPCFLWVGTHAWASALSMTSCRGRRCAPVPRDSAYYYRLFFCVVWLIVGILCEQTVTPHFFQAAMKLM